MIPEWIPMLIILLFGLNNPNDLRKQPTKKDFKKSFNYWVQRNFPVIAFITVMICLVIFVLVCFLTGLTQLIEVTHLFIHSIHSVNNLWASTWCQALWKTLRIQQKIRQSDIVPDFLELILVGIDKEIKPKQ